MADISKITLPNGQQYNLKDQTARNTGKVSGVKGHKENSYRTGNVDITPDNIGAVAKNAELLTTNPFAPVELKGPYISKIDNALYAADKRWNVTATNVSGSIKDLFDGNYETQVRINNNETAVITIDFSNEPGGHFQSYPYGYFLISFYYVTAPKSITGRVYCNYSPQGIGWHDITFTHVGDTTTSNTYRGYNSYYAISKVEISIVGDSSNSYGYTAVSEIELHLDRPNPANNPFVSKYSAETLYYNLTAPNFIGNLQGNATSATKVNNHTVNSDVPANAKFTDTVTTVTTTGSGNAVTAISASNGALTATKDITFATKQESLNHVVASKTQPSNQQAGDIWLIIK